MKMKAMCHFIKNAAQSLATLQILTEQSDTSPLFDIQMTRT